MPFKTKTKRREWRAKYLKRRKENGNETAREHLVRKFCQIRRRAAVRGQEFSLTLEDVKRLLSSPCIYGGGLPTSVSVGVDRMDSKQGYTVANSVPCCLRHNTMKGNFFSFLDMRDIVTRYENAKRCGNRGEF